MDDEHTTDRRVKFDFEVDFSNGGGLQGQDFRLDIEGEDISEEELRLYLVEDMRLLKRLGGCRCVWKRSWRSSGSRCPKLPSSPGGAAVVRLRTGAPRPRLHRRAGSPKP